jgi:hypothetical protein
MASHETADSEASEPCAACGEETAVGSAFYSDRRQIDRTDGSSAFICTLCDQRIAGSRRGSRMSDEDLRAALETGSLAMISGNTAGRILRGF